jgi:hypothetical protein
MSAVEASVTFEPKFNLVLPGTAGKEPKRESSATSFKAQIFEAEGITAKRENGRHLTSRISWNFGVLKGTNQQHLKNGTEIPRTQDGSIAEMPLDPPSGEHADVSGPIATESIGSPVELPTSDIGASELAVQPSAGHTKNDQTHGSANALAALAGTGNADSTRTPPEPKSEIDIGDKRAQNRPKKDRTAPTQESESNMPQATCVIEPMVDGTVPVRKDEQHSESSAVPRTHKISLGKNSVESSPTASRETRSLPQSGESADTRRTSASVKDRNEQPSSGAMMKHPETVLAKEESPEIKPSVPARMQQTEGTTEYSTAVPYSSITSTATANTEPGHSGPAIPYRQQVIGTAPDVAAGTNERQILKATPTTLEVGISSGSHGWLRVRAEMTTDGQVSASLSSSSHAGQQMLHNELSSLTTFLRAENVTVGLLRVREVASASDRNVFAGDSASSMNHRQPEQDDSGGGPTNMNDFNSSIERVEIVSQEFSAAEEEGSLATLRYARSGSWLNVIA